MPGLFGIISKNKTETCKRQVEIMLSSMTYEDFFRTGTYNNPEIGIYVGWTHNASYINDCMPASNNTRNVFLFLVGELYNNQQSDRSQAFEYGDSNQAFLIRSYEKYEEDFPKQLNGSFCGLLLDNRNGKVFLFNDRYGMYRLFIHQNSEGIFFSSEAKALLSVLPNTRYFNPEGLGELITCGCTIGNHSLYRGIDIISPGSLLTFDHGEVKRQIYFDPSEWKNQDKIKEKDFSNTIVDLFGSIVQKYSGGTEPVGISLTGGLDSRMIMSCLDNSPGKYPCYTFSSMYRESFDVSIARKIAKICNQPFHTIVLSRDFLDNFENYIEKAIYISDGYIGMSGAAELYLNSQARKITPVRLTGNYGGELLRGTRSFKCQMPKGTFILPEYQRYLKNAQIKFHNMESADAITYALFRQAPSQGYGRLSVERSQVIMRTPFMDNELVKLSYQASPILLKNNSASLEIISRHRPDLLKIPTDRGLLPSDSYFRHFVRKLYYETIIKSEYFSSHGMPDWLASRSQHSPARLLEKLFLGRNKFQHFYTWSRTFLANYIIDVLSQGIDNLGNFFDTKQVNNIIQEHKSGRKNYIDEIDILLLIAQVDRIFLKSNSFGK